MTHALEDKCKDLVVELKLEPVDAIVEILPLTGGVASDIAQVSFPSRHICVKFALPKLKVAADWFAPVHRNRAEYEWLRVAGEIAPESAIKVFGRSEVLHGFAMEFLEGEDVYLWKSALLEEAAPKGEAQKVGDVLGQIHAASVQTNFNSDPFHNHNDFRALRIEPYLSYTAIQHPDLSEIIIAIADMLYESRQVLVHGDVSPKNIMFRDGMPVILDAECATMGDASFDPAFCLNHLILKALHLPGSCDVLFDEILAFWHAYAAHVTWEPVADLEARICQLLPALMLARVDGKSPAEYLDPDEQEKVRQLSQPLLMTPVKTIDELVSRVTRQMKDFSQ